MVTAGPRRVTLIVVLAMVILSAPLSSACFHSLRRAPYETYWLGTYYDSRILSLSCFALRTFRWTLKFIKTTYEGWHVEMEYARCISETYGMNIPLISPPWNKQARMYSDHMVDHFEHNGKPHQMARHEQYFFDLPLPTKSNSAMHSSSSQNGADIFNYDVQRWKAKQDVEEIITSLQPLFSVNDKISDSLIPKDNGSAKEAVRILKSLFNIFQSLLKEFETLFSRTLGTGILSCTRKYIKNAFWRWVDSAPFLH